MAESSIKFVQIDYLAEVEFEKTGIEDTYVVVSTGEIIRDIGDGYCAVFRFD